MAYKVILIENEVDIKLKLDNLVIYKSGNEIWVPMDDISVVILDNLKINITVRMLSLMAEHNIALIVCDIKHNPLGFYCSYDNHSRMSKMIGNQISRTRGFYDELWKIIVKSKIENQAQVLELLDKSSDTVIDMRKFKENVSDGDKSNREAHGAKIYFNTLMNTSFSRGNEDILLNSGLDYGYAILRSYIARLCVGYGLNTQIGIHHKNEYNRFNLVDDVMEPFRPIVDIYVYRILNGEEYFKQEHRHKIINLLNHYIKYNNKKMILCNALEEYIERMSSYISGREVDLVFPETKYYIGESDEI
jgi:CRISPR-associated protein Cas1